MVNTPDYVKELLRKKLDKELKRQAKEKFREEVIQFVFSIFVIFVFIISLHLGFNVCMKPDGDCKNNPESLLFTPQK